MTISAGILEIEVKLKNQQLDSQLAQTHSKLKASAAQTAAQISKAHAQAFAQVSRSAIMMGRQVTTILKMISVPIIGALGKSVHSLFASQSEAGDEARKKWSELKSVIDENMVRIGYYVSQSKIFGKNMYEWADKFGQILSKITKGDIQKMINYLEAAAVAMGAIKAATIGLKIAVPTARLIDRYGPAGMLAGGAIGGSAIAGVGSLSAAQMGKMMGHSHALNKKQMDAALKVFGGASLAEKTGILAKYISGAMEGLAAFASMITGLAGFLNGLAGESGFKDLGTAAKATGNALVTTVGGVVKTIGISLFRVSELIGSTIREIGTGKKTTKNIGGFTFEYSPLSSYGKIYADYRKKAQSDLDNMFKGMIPELDIVKDKEPSFRGSRSLRKQEDILLALQGERQYSSFALDMAEVAANIQNKTYKEEIKLNEQWRSDILPLYEKKWDLEEEDATKTKERVQKITEAANAMGIKDFTMGKIDEYKKLAEDIISQRNAQPMGYTGQKVGITELGAFSTQMQAQKLGSQADASQKLVDAIKTDTVEQAKRGKEITSNTTELSRLTRFFSSMSMGYYISPVQEGFSQY